MKLDSIKNKNYSNISTLISAIIFFIIGSIIFSNPNSTVKFISYVLGGSFSIVGLFKIISYYLGKKKEKGVSIKDLSIGIIAFICGLVLIIFSNAIEVLTRVIMGAWILFNGINLLTSSLKVIKSQDNSPKVLLVLAIVMIIGGLYMILRNNLVFQMIGLFIMIYALIEIIGYIYFVGKN